VDTTCVGSPDSCCTDSQYWVTGAISYTFDQDWYRYEHPCPDADCMLRIHFEIESGPTDVLMAIYRGWSMWYDTVVYDPDDPISDIGNQPANNGVCGDNECLYAHHEDSDAYYFNVRDTIFVSTGDTNNGTWDWSREQTYRFCIAKYAEGCLEPPCHDWGEDNHGCGPPEEE